VTVVLEGKEQAAVADPLRRLLADEEVAVALHDPHELVVCVLLGTQGLDAMQELVVREGQPALLGGFLVGSLLPGLADGLLGGGLGGVVLGHGCPV
jgi:hypothetical protein